MGNVYRPAWRNQWFAAFIAILFFAFSIYILIRFDLLAKGTNPVIFGLWLFILLVFLLVVLYRRACWKFIITDQTIESRSGIISRNVKSIRIKDLRNVNVKQSLFQRILGVGDVEFSSAGGADIEVAFFGVTKPMEIKEKVQALQADT